MRWIARVCRGAFCVIALLFASESAISQQATKPQDARTNQPQTNGVPDAADKDYSGELPRIPPKSPMEELQSFEVASGFTVELVAAEQLVADPVAFAFDARNRLFVVEMKDYSEQETEALGSIALLTDVNDDGKMDERSTFVDGLSWPTAIWPWRDGVLVAEPPRITWFRDTDDDGKCDTKEVWFEGFQRTNVQGLVNSLRWGVDGYIHGATSSSGADLAPNKTTDRQIQLRGRDFAIDPLTKVIEPESGGGQHGMCFNRWGDKFVTSNSDHLQQIIDLDRWLSQHPASVAIPSLRRSIAEDGPQAEVFRASPVEPWRIVRTRLRMSGVAPGIVEGGGRAAGYFTGATATLIMDSESEFGVAGFDTALVCDVGSNLVHRKQLRSNGLFWTASRIDVQNELLRSSDIWFRPVQLGDGPDGAVYIADMYREVIEHPKSLPPMIKKHLDLTSGRDKGRIWRLKRKESNLQAVASKPIANCSNEELVERLASPIAWQRRAASQALVERGAQMVAPELKRLAATAASEARILALHCLRRLNQLDQATIVASLRSTDPHVLRHAIALANVSQFASESFEALSQAAISDDPAVQLQLALAAADLPESQRLALLQQLMSAQEPLVRAAIVTAAGKGATKLIASRSLSPESLQAWLKLMMPSWSKATGGQARQVSEVLSDGLANDATRTSWLAGLRSLSSATDAGQVLKLADPATVNKTLHSIATAIESSNAENKATPESTLACLGLLDDEQQMRLANELLVAAQPEHLQMTVIESLLWSNPKAASQLLIDRFQNFTPALQLATLGGLLRYQSTLSNLASGLETKKVLSAQVPPDMRARLLATADKVLGKKFESLLQSATADRAEVIVKYTPALSATEVGSNASDTRELEAGKQVFNRVCAQCHRLAEMGNDVGPPLKQLGEKSPQQLLETILDPNREVDPKYASYTIVMQDGRVFAGIIAEEAASQIVVAEAGGKKHTIPRTEIEQLRSTGVSLMPSGLEQQITPEQMSALIRFLKHAK